MTIFDELLSKRKSVRKFSQHLISMQKMMLLKEAARKAPSAGAVRPVSIYIVENKDSKGAVNHAIWKACNKQKAVLQAPLLIVFCVNFPKIQKRYGNRGNRYALLEVGHMAQNVCLKAIDLGLVTCCIGAFKDSRIKQVLNCEYRESPVYIIAVGYPK